MYGGYYGYYYDATYVLVLIGALLCIGASTYLNSTFKKYSQIRSRRGITGEEAALRILKAAGIGDVTVTHVTGSLTDHYNPRKKEVCLSDAVYGSNSLAALGVAAHECGHAIQHQQKYMPLQLRSALVPVTNIGSKVGLPLVIIGLLLGLNTTLVPLGIIIFSVTVLFQIVTLPVEFNASRRAVGILGSSGILYEEETQGCQKVLFAAALTYVAAAASSILQLLRLILLSGNRRRRD